MNNIHEEPLRIQFSLLKRWDNDSIHKSICPICGGLLLMERNNETFLLLNTDRCVTCGQRFIYIDIPNNKLSFISDYMLSTYWKEQRLKKLNRIINGN